MEDAGIFSNMRADHRRVLAEIESLEGAARDPAAPSHPEPRLTALVELLEQQFKTHMRAEEEVLFPALAAALPAAAGTITQLELEHEELRLMLKTLGETLRQPVQDDLEERIAVQVQDLGDLLRIHVRKEETLAFDLAERALPAADLARLAAHITSTGVRDAGSIRKEDR